MTPLFRLRCAASALVRAGRPSKAICGVAAREVRGLDVADLTLRDQAEGHMAFAIRALILAAAAVDSDAQRASLVDALAATMRAISRLAPEAFAETSGTAVRAVVAAMRGRRRQRKMGTASLAALPRLSEAARGNDHEPGGIQKFPTVNRRRTRVVLTHRFFSCWENCLGGHSGKPEKSRATRKNSVEKAPGGLLFLFCERTANREKLRVITLRT